MLRSQVAADIADAPAPLLTVWSQTTGRPPRVLTFPVSETRSLDQARLSVTPRCPTRSLQKCLISAKAWTFLPQTP